jgi:hypothetical protein
MPCSRQMRSNRVRRGFDHASRKPRAVFIGGLCDWAKQFDVDQLRRKDRAFPPRCEPRRGGNGNRPFEGFFKGGIAYFGRHGPRSGLFGAGGSPLTCFRGSIRRQERFNRYSIDGHAAGNGSGLGHPLSRSGILINRLNSRSGILINRLNFSPV